MIDDKLALRLRLVCGICFRNAMHEILQKCVSDNAEYALLNEMARDLLANHESPEQAHETAMNEAKKIGDKYLRTHSNDPLVQTIASVFEAFTAVETLIQERKAGIEDSESIQFQFDEQVLTPHLAPLRKLARNALVSENDRKSAEKAVQWLETALDIANMDRAPTYGEQDQIFHRRDETPTRSVM
jgi:hypothetical protein